MAKTDLACVAREKIPAGQKNGPNITHNQQVNDINRLDESWND
jgi:hypothetical protein